MFLEIISLKESKKNNYHFQREVSLKDKWKKLKQVSRKNNTEHENELKISGSQKSSLASLKMTLVISR